MDFILMSIWFEGTAGKRTLLYFHLEIGLGIAEKKREWDLGWQIGS